MSRKILTVIGARPQFIKAAMLSRALREAGMQEVSVHTGQHYDPEMSAIFFEEMKIPQPHYNLQAGSATHGRQTGFMLEKLDEILEKENPDAVLVYGDTNSTLAGALAAAKKGVPVIHVEAGMRSYDKKQPEEINRLLTDHCSSLLICSSEEPANNLRKEGVTEGIVVTGDIMRDSTETFAAMPSGILQKLGIAPKSYFLVTLHRPETTDHKERLAAVVAALTESPAPIVFPVHPRTKKLLKEFGLFEELSHAPNIHIIEPVGYIDMLHLQKHAEKIITDSGGVQKEAYWLHVPCITVREYTEWRELVETGWNVVSGYNKNTILRHMNEFTPPKNRPELFGNGKAAQRMAAAIQEFLS